MAKKVTAEQARAYTMMASMPFGYGILDGTAAKDVDLATLTDFMGCLKPRLVDHVNHYKRISREHTAFAELQESLRKFLNTDRL